MIENSSSVQYIKGPVCESRVCSKSIYLFSSFFFSPNVIKCFSLFTNASVTLSLVPTKMELFVGSPFPFGISVGKDSDANFKSSTEFIQWLTDYFPIMLVGLICKLIINDIFFFFLMKMSG